MTGKMRHKIRPILIGVGAGILVSIGLFYISNFIAPLPAYYNTDFLARPDSMVCAGTAISDTQGALNEVIVHFNSATARYVLPSYRDIFRQMNKDVTVYVACPAREEFDEFLGYLLESGVENPERFVPVIMNCPITVWARDRFIAKVPGEKGVDGILAVPLKPENSSDERSNDWFVSWRLSDMFPERYSVEKTFMDFHGGDIINADGLMFLDFNLVQKNTGPHFKTAEQFISYIEGRFGRKAVVLGNEFTPVPDHHIEMYITPLNEKTILAGDPCIAKELLNSADAGCIRDADFSEEAILPFRNAAVQLEQAGFSVVRIPLVPTSVPNVFVSYNNVVLETREGKSICYMPVYGLDVLDGYARKVWELQGYEVKPVDVSRLYRLGGVVRCLVNVLKRRMKNEK
ncbi:MAG: hypothetical protein HZA48_01650 [Planctomycetes bacterium]|nr:hypothetical protein [Planctomycetota bacterium]